VPSFGNFLGRSVSEAAGFGAGLAIGPALHPVVREITNRTWALHPDMPLAPGEAAAVAAELIDQYDRMATEASFSGLDGDRFRDLYGVNLTAPGFGELVTMLRRATITPDDFAHGLRKAKLEPRWDTALSELQHVRLSPAQLALGIVRSVVPDPGLLAVELDLSGGVVPAYPQWGGDVIAEALAGGFDKDRLRVLVGEIGLPMSAQQAASAYFRGIIEHGDFNRAILEGDTRPEWAPYILEQARQIPTAHDFIEKRLRGWTDEAGMLAGVRRHGMSDTDAETLYLITGRPLSFHQVFIGERRGGVYDGDTSIIDAAFLKSLRESNIRPEWYNLAWAQRYSLPSAFVFRALLQGGAITTAQGEQYFLDLGWPPDLAKQVAEHYGKATATSADPHVTKAQNQLWTTMHAAYKAGSVEAADVTPGFDLLAIPAAAQTEILTLWDFERGLHRKQLTPAQVKKAYTKAEVNNATGAPWTQDEAVAALVAQGYSPENALNFLNL
jgi:hypothetical protein